MVSSVIVVSQDRSSVVRIRVFDEISSDVARFCSEYKTAFMGIYIAGFLGIIFGAMAFALYQSGRRRIW